MSIRNQQMMSKQSTLNNNTNNITTVSETAMKPRVAQNMLPANPNASNAAAKETLKTPDAPVPVKVVSRIIFLKVGQIDTRNERYDAEAYIECTWEDDNIFKYLSDPNIGGLFD